MLQKRFLISFLCLSLSYTIHAVHILDALNYFLHSTEPKIHRDYSSQHAHNAEEISRIKRDKIIAHGVAIVFLCSCVFTVMMYQGKRSG